MKALDLKKKMRLIVSMEEEEFNRKLFFDEAFLNRYTRLEKEYGDYLLKKGRQTGALKLEPLMPEQSNHVVLATPSTRKKGSWNRTVFVQGKPLSHREYDTFEELMTENVPEWFRHALWVSEEDSNQ